MFDSAEVMDACINYKILQLMVNLVTLIHLPLTELFNPVTCVLLL